MGKREKRRLLSTCLSLAVPLLAAAPALAQNESAASASDEIIVTAMRREQALQDVPIAINVFSEEQLQDSGATDFASIVDQISGVELRANQTGSGAVAVRGIAELNTNNIFGATGTAVGLYIDEAPFSVGGFFPQAAMFDVQRVEVLRGPQGTIFGEGSLAGTIRVISNAPDARAVDATFDASYGQIEDGEANSNINLMLNLPLIEDVLAVRLTGFHSEEGGWVDRIDPIVTASFLPPPNPILGPAVPDVLSTFTAGPITEDVNDGTTSGGRVQMQWTPDSSFTATLSAMGQTSERGFRNRGTEDRIGSFSTSFEHMDDEFEVYSLVLEKEVSFGSFLSSTNYFDRQVEQTHDQIGIIPLANQIGYPITGGAFTFQGSRAEFDIGVTEFNQELRFVSDFEGPFQLTAGVFYRDRDIRFGIYAPQEPLVPGAIANALSGGLLGLIFAPNPVPDGFGDLDSISDSNTTQTAIFAEGTYDINDQWTFLLGARYFEDERESLTTATSLFSGIPFPTDFASAASENVFNPRASITFEPSDDLTTYFSVGRGFRSGGQNDLYPLVAGATVDDLVYDPETLTTYELGLKYYQRNTGLNFNAALFYNQWQDLQVVTAEGVGGVGEIIGNAGDARSIGLDLEANWRATDSWTFTGAATLLDTKLEDIIASGTPIAEADIPEVADTTASLAATYRAPMAPGMDLFARGGVVYRSDALSSLLRIGSPTERIDGYTTLDLRAGIETPHWSLSLFVDNATDEFIPLSRFVSTNPSNPAGGDPVTGDDLFFQGSPRVIGVNLRWRLQGE
jgi:outer membrane receptor protein involved in Fe transport